jgi:HD-GYP domain-containing protein (c-di-GMP phosphodiesterase class II)/PAS domain-containing protein
VPTIDRDPLIVITTPQLRKVALESVPVNGVGPPSVLLAVSRPGRRERLRRALVAAGHAVVAVPDLERGAMAAGVDLILAEWRGAEGWPDLADVSAPVVAILGRDRLEEIGDVLAAGADDYIVGATSVPDLMARAKLALRRRVRAGADGDARVRADLRCATDGTIVAASGAVARVIGMPARDLLALPWSGLAHSADAPRVAEALVAATGDEGPVVIVHRVRRGDGHYAWVEARLAAEPPTDRGERIVAVEVREAPVSGGSGGVGELAALASAVARGASPGDVMRCGLEAAMAISRAPAAAVIGDDGTVVASVGVWPTRPVRGELPGSLAAPIRGGRRRRGSLVVARMPGHHDAARPERVARIAELIGLGLVRDISGPRPAVRLVDDRRFWAALERQFVRARRTSHPFAVALFDVHDPEAPRSLARREELLAHAEPVVEARSVAGRRVGRIGDRLGWVLPESDEVTAWVAVERTRIEMTAALQETGDVVVSAGLAQGGECRDPEHAVRHARAALYWTSGNGGGMTFAHSPAVAPLVDSAGGVDLASLAETVGTIDPLTGAHSRRVADTALAIATRLGWSLERRTTLAAAALVHDVGKIAVPQAIIAKAGKLDRHEYEIVKAHARVGGGIVATALSAEQAAWVRGHHERWDGLGYPDGLSGEAIPEGARIIAVADAWDAMVSTRSYREPLTVEAALEELRRCTGRQFWPDAVDALGAVVERRELAPALG